MSLRTIGRTILLCALLAWSASAHDFWIEPSSFTPKSQERMSFDLKVGERFVGESVARNPLRIVRFVALDAAGKDEAILGLDGKVPAGLYRTHEPGLVLVGYRSSTTAIELEAEKFEKYLETEGLEHVIEARRKKGESAKKGLEIYARSAKSLVLVDGLPKAGIPALKGFDQRLGLTLEVVPLKNPYALKPLDELALQVLYQEKPLAHALVGCMSKSAPEDEKRLRTDAEGRVTFKLAATGVHLVRVVHMVPAPVDSGADWESLWGSLTFEVPAAPAPAK